MRWPWEERPAGDGAETPDEVVVNEVATESSSSLKTRAEWTANPCIVHEPTYPQKSAFFKDVSRPKKWRCDITSFCCFF
jgi:hypothetical protein